MIPLLLSATAVIAYFLGCIDLTGVSCRYFLHRRLRAFGRGQQGMEALYRETGLKGLAAVYLPEMVKTVLAVLIGGWLMAIQKQTEIGRLFALFCLLMGSMFPAPRRFVGSQGILTFCVGILAVNPKVGIMAFVVFAGVTALSKYLTLALVCASLFAVVGAWVFMAGKISILLALFCTVIIIVRNYKHIVRMIYHTEPKLSKKKDLSYKFDKDF